MADRTQNINIVYKVNTVDVEKASATLNKAKAANDALVKSAQDLGTQGQKSASQYSQTIAGLTLQMQQLKAQIDLTKQSDTARLQQLTGQYKEMQTQLNKYKSAVDTATAANKSMADSIGGIYSMIRIALTAGLIKETITAALEMSRLKGQVDGVTRAFNNITNATLLMADLKAKTHGTLDDLTLMQKAIQAQNFKIPLEKLGSLLEFAAVKAQQTGIDINYLTDSIITGLGRNSLKILDNLQFSMTELKQKSKELGSTQEAVFFLVNKQMQQMGGYVETDAQKVDRLAAAWKNFKILISEGSSAGWITWLTEGLDAARRAIMGTKAAQDEFAKSMAVIQVNSFTSNKPGFGETQSEIDNIKQLIISRKTDIELLKVQIETVRTASNLTQEDRIKQNQSLSEQVKVLQDRNDISKAYIGLLGEYQEALSMVTPDEKEELGVVEGLKKRLEEVNSEIEKNTDTNLASNQAKLQEAKELQRLIDLYTTLDDGMLKRDEFTKKYYDDWGKKIEEIAAKLIKNFGQGLPKGSQPAGGFKDVFGNTPDTGVEDGIDNSMQSQFDRSYKYAMTFWDKLAMGFSDMGKKIHKSTEETVADQRRQWMQAAKTITNSIIDGLQTIMAAQIQSETQVYDNRLAAAQDYYSKQIELAGDNQTAKSALQKKEDAELKKIQKERDAAAQRQATRMIILNTAMAIIKALAEVPWPYSIAVAAAAGITGASQLAAAKKAPPGYAKGVIGIKGEGSETSDSIHVRVSKGESIMTAEETRNNMSILKAIRAKKINDKFINEIISKSGGSQATKWSDARIVAAIEANKAPDLVRQGATIYEAKQLANGAKKYIRSKFLG